MARSYIKEEERTVVNEKLGVLTNEIQEELIRISTLSRFKVCSDIESIRQRSLLEKAPDAEFAIRLFRKYSTSIRSLKPAEKGNERFGSQLQSYLSEGD